MLASPRLRSSLDDESPIHLKEPRADVPQGPALPDQLVAEALTLQHQQPGQEPERLQGAPVSGTSSGRNTCATHRCRSASQAGNHAHIPSVRIAAITGIRLSVECRPGLAHDAARQRRRLSRERLRLEPAQGQPEPDCLPLVAVMPSSGSHPVPKQRRGLGRIRLPRPSGRAPATRGAGRRGPEAEQPVGGRHEEGEPFDDGTGFSCARRRRWLLTHRADEAIERREIRVSRVLPAKPIQRIAGVFEPSREERGDEDR